MFYVDWMYLCYVGLGQRGGQTRLTTGDGIAFDGLENGFASGVWFMENRCHTIFLNRRRMCKIFLYRNHMWKYLMRFPFRFLGGGWGYRGVLTRGHGRNTSNKANTQDRTHRNTSCNVLKSGTYAFIWTTSIFIQDNTKKPNAAEADRHRLNISLKSYNISSTWSQQ